MPNLAELFRRGGTSEEEAGIATDLKGAEMPASGIERIASVIAAMASKLLEILVPLFGSDSEQGKRILRSIRTLSPLTKGVKAEDIGAILKILENVVATRPISPETMETVKGMAGMPGMPKREVTPSPLPAPPPPGGEGARAGLEGILR